MFNSDLITFCFVFGVAGSAKLVPKIKIDLCDGLIRDSNINICCRTDNLETSDVIIEFVPLDNPTLPLRFGDGELVCENTSFNDPVQNGTANLTCVRAGGVKIYKIRLDYSEAYLHGNWTCRSYAGVSQFAIEYVADRYDGEIKTLSGTPVNSTWIMAGNSNDSVTVLSPNGTAICQFNSMNPTGSNIATCRQDRVNATHINVTLMVSNTTYLDGGRFTCVDRSNNYVSFTILTIIRPPSIPSFVPMELETKGTKTYPSKGDKTSITVFCVTESRVSSSLSYVPDLKVGWRTPSSTCNVKSTRCDITDIDCSAYNRALIGCIGYENTAIGNISTSVQWASVQDFCETNGRLYSQLDDGLTTVIAIAYAVCTIVLVILCILIVRRRSGLRVCCCSCRNLCRPCLRLFRFVKRMCCGLPRRSRQYEEMRDRNADQNPDAALNVNDSGAARGLRQEAEAAAQLNPRASGLEASFGRNDILHARDRFADEVRIRLMSLSVNLRNPAITIRVKRDQIVDDVMRFYEEQTERIVNTSLSASFKGEPGLDAGGVTRDMLTTFWLKASEIYFDGNISFIPKYDIQHHHIELFRTIGRILAHSTLILQTIPIQICRSTLILMIFGDMPMVEDVILEDFLLYIDLRHRLVLQTALQNFDGLDNEQSNLIGEIFSHYEMGKIPRRDTFRHDLLQIAYNELCIKPKMVCEQMMMGIPQATRVQFWAQLTFQHIDALYEDFKPTAKQVMTQLLCNPRSLQQGSVEQICFDNLKRFILHATPELLLCFLQFVTAERKVPTRPINVQFTDVQGLARCPVAHTCSNQLELPKTYTVYEELASEFTAILTSTEGFRFSMH